MIRAVVICAALASVVSVHAADDPPSAPAAGSAEGPSVEAGRRAYTSTCARCHGINLVSTSSAFFDLRTFPKDEKDRFIASVTYGKRQMPAWGGTVKPEAIEAIWLYIGNVNGW
jgi:mono/diheme cytochrome c family protein